MMCYESRGLRSVRKVSVSIEWSRRNEWMVGGESGVGLMESLLKTEIDLMESSRWKRMMAQQKNQKRL